MVKAAAVAAGARIATPADASSLMEAARSQNVVHITTGGSSAMKSSTSSLISQLPSNVHFIRNGLAKAPISTYSAAKPSISRAGEAQQAQAHSINPAASAVRPNPMGPAVAPNATSASIPSVALHRATEATTGSTSTKEIEVIVQRYRGVDDQVRRAPNSQLALVGNPSEKLEKNETSASSNALKGGSTGGDQASVSNSGPMIKN